MHETRRKSSSLSLVETSIHDMRHGVRVLLRSPTFTLIAIVSLALGIGANSATFGFADALLLRPLPVEDPDEIVALGSLSLVAGSVSSRLRVSYPDFVDLRDRADAFSGLTASLDMPVQFKSSPLETSEVRTGTLVSGDFFEVLGVRPDLGRGFRPDEYAVPERDAVAVVSHRFWQSQYNADPAIVGRRMTVNGRDFTIVGVAPERFTGLDSFVRSDFYMPLMMWPAMTRLEGESPLEQRDQRSLTVKGRLRSGTSMDEVRGDVIGIGAALAETYPVTNRGYEMQVRTELENRIQTTGLANTVLMLLTLGSLVLLVACINLAGLIASRAPARSAEISLRLSMGASRMRIVRQLMTESAILAALGGLAGVGLGYLGIRLWSQLVVHAEVATELPFRMDDRFALVSVGVTVASVFLFGLAPALQASRESLTAVLRRTSRGIVGRSGWGRRALVGGQVSVALVLIAVAVFMYTAFLRQVEAGPGVRIDDIMTMSFDPHLSRYATQDAQLLYEQLVDRARGLPGVESASLASFVPMSGFPVGQTAIVPDGYELPQGLESDRVATSYVDSDFFDVMDVSVSQGRGFDTGDEADTLRVAVVNQLLADRYWSETSPIGQRFRIAGDDEEFSVEIVGVVETGRYFAISENPTPFLYLPYQQQPQSRMTLVVRSQSDLATLAEPLRSIVREVDADLAVTAVRTMADLYYDTAIRNFLVIMQAIGAMGIVGVVLAFVGLYGLVAADVNRRTREIGIRMALGASRGSVLLMMLFRGLQPAFIGLTVGVVLMIGVSKIMTAAFPGGGGSERGLGVWFWVTGAVLAVTALAAFLPARRAVQLGPSHSLKHD